jgi:hypothetical protein
MLPETLIRTKAPEVADQILRIGASAHNEEELRIGVAALLKTFASEIGIPLEDRHEYSIARGRADSTYGRLVIEYEHPHAFTDTNASLWNRRAIEQVKGYLKALDREEGRSPPRMLGVCLDGTRVIFVKYREGRWQEEPPVAVSARSIEQFLLRLASLAPRGKALTAENLLQDFGPDADRPGPASVKVLYGKLRDITNSKKVNTLLLQWDTMFGQVSGYDAASAERLIQPLAHQYGIFDSKIHPGKFLFALHTYYAAFMKLLAAHMVTLQTTGLARLGQWLTMPARRFMEELRHLEDGDIFRSVGIRNFLEGDFFRWYLEIWDGKLDDALRGIVQALDAYDPDTLRVEPEETRDLLKQLYQGLLPRGLRHGLGEYYTPDWLADLTIDESGYDGDPDTRVLDPACGSGTFLVLLLRRAIAAAAERQMPERDLLAKLTSNIVGFDLNPLAVIAARTNYLMAIRDLLPYRQGEIDIPVYLCDSVLVPTEVNEGREEIPLITTAETFVVPRRVVDGGKLDALAGALERCVEHDYPRDDFLALVAEELRFSDEDTAATRHILGPLYDQLLKLKKQDRNGIWARIIKNAFAPLFQSQRPFDIVVGNPPWVNWESLPPDYRKRTQELWKKYGLFTLSGTRARLGGGKKDISMIMAYVAMDRYLRDGGILAFIITQTVFKSRGAGEGFRRFNLAPDTNLLGDEGVPAKPVEVLRVHDLVSVQPFAGAANRTAVMVLQKGRPTSYPVPYIVWRRKERARVNELMALRDVRPQLEQTELVAEPLIRATDPWLTARKETLPVLRKAIGPSRYRAWEGSNTGGANGVYWVEVVEELPDGKLLIRNLHDVGKTEGIPALTRPVEHDLVYPLLRGRDVQRWVAAPSAHIILAQNPDTRVGWPESEMRVRWPNTYAYLKEFEPLLRQRPAYKKYFKPDDPFYTMFAVGPYTLAPYKVVWPEVSGTMRAAVSGPAQDPVLGRRPVMPDHTLILVDAATEQEAHYIAGVMNSSLTRLFVESYVALHPSPHVLEHFRLPRFDPDDPSHTRLAALAAQATRLAAEDGPGLGAVERQIDAAVAQLFGLTPQELEALQEAAGS